MSYIGNQPVYQAFVTDQFSGNGSTTAFTMSVAPANTASVLVAVSGVLQDPSTYSVSGTTLTFSAAPPSGTGNISARYLGIPASGVTTTAYRTVTNFTATAGQTTFTPPSYTAGYIDVYRNGVKLALADFTATNGTTVVLATGATAGDVIETDSFYVSSVLNAIPATAGAVTDPYILTMSASKLTGTQTIPKTTLPTGSILQVVQALTQSQTSTTSSTYTAATNLSLSITPTSSTSKILLMATMGTIYNNGTGSATSAFTFYRNGSDIAPTTRGFMLNSFYNAQGPSMMMYLDSPATTSATTYQVYFKTNSNTTYVGGSDGGVFTSSTITAMEVAA